MDNKLYNNRFLDILTGIADLFVVCGILFVCMSLLEKIDAKVIALYTVTTFFVLNLYDVYSKTIRRKYDLILTIGISVVISSFVCFIMSLIFKRVFMHFSLLFYIGVTLLLIVALSIEKELFSKIIKRVEGAPTLLVLDTKREKSNLVRKIKYSYCVLYEAWYDLIDDEDENVIDQILEEKFPKFNSVFLSPAIKDDVKYRLISEALKVGKEIYVLPDMYNISTLRSQMVQFDDTPALLIRQLGFTKWQKFFKRILDIAFSFFLAVISSPIMLLCAIAVKLDSPGPIIYKQERLTINQKPFNIYKFRTMIADAESRTGAVLATEGDPRITRVGKFLRLTRLDELPQLYNILFGHMSIVGPRPERRVFVDEYLETVDNYDKRFLVKAGLTGLAQVYGKYQTQIKDKNLYDIMYIREFSFLLDLKIIFLTVKTMFIKESSSGISDKQKDYETDVHESKLNNTQGL